MTIDDIQSHINDPIPGIHQNLILKLPCDELMTEQACQLIGKSGKALMKLIDASDGSCHVFEIRLEQILSNEIVLEMSSKLVKYLDQWKEPQKGDICFRFVDVFKFMHRAIERADLDSVFPQQPERTDSAWSTFMHSDLSKDQSIALNEMVKTDHGPPVLILGPFGSGKTRTMATAIVELLKRMDTEGGPECKILICTHSNSAADHYIEDFIDPFLRTYETSREHMLIRVNWELRYTASVSRTVLNYCEVKDGRFVQPTKDKIQKYSMVVSTLVTADILTLLDLPRDHFTHIFIDEAAQAMEVEAIIPLALKGPATKVILAGDHLQVRFYLLAIRVHHVVNRPPTSPPPYTSLIKRIVFVISISLVVEYLLISALKGQTYIMGYIQFRPLPSWYLISGPVSVALTYSFHCIDFQLGPYLSSKTAKRLGLGISLLERLFQEYPEDSPFKLKLLENFRSFKEIVEISSALFYEGALLSNKVRAPEVSYPLKFYGIHGKEKVSRYHPSYFNLAEANEVLYRIKKLRETWPSVLGKFQPAMICVLCCFAAQVSVSVFLSFDLLC